MNVDDSAKLIREQIEHVKQLPKMAITYIVLDHSYPPGEWLEGTDGDDQGYVLVSPAILDELKHRQSRSFGPAESLFGIPVYRRENLDPAWPAFRRPPFDSHETSPW